MLEGRCLEFKQRTGEALEVDEVFGRPLVPRWLGNGVPMTAELARRIYLFRVQAAETLRDGDAALHAWLKSDFHLNDDAADLILRLIQEQETVSEVPPADALLIECVPMQSCVEYFVHTPLPRSANEALVRRVAWAIGASRQRGRRQSRFLLDRACGRSDAGGRLADRLACRRFRGGFADRPGGWRIDAALFRQRRPDRADAAAQSGRAQRKVGGKDWAQRRLFDQLRDGAPDFLLLRQAEREVLDSACDLATALAFAERLRSMPIRVRRLPGPSPLGESLLQAGFQAEMITAEPMGSAPR